MIDVTPNEFRVLRSIATNDYGGRQPGEEVWADSINCSKEPSGLTGKSLSAICTSLTKKNLVTSAGENRCAVIALTVKGHERAHQPAPRESEPTLAELAARGEVRDDRPYLALVAKRDGGGAGLCKVFATKDEATSAVKARMRRNGYDIDGQQLAVPMQQVIHAGEMVALLRSVANPLNGHGLTIRNASAALLAKIDRAK